MTHLKATIISLIGMFALTTHISAQEDKSCITHQDLVQMLVEKLKPERDQALEFRINKAEDGQSLLYWHTGGSTGSFFATTFKSDGCAILTTTGEPRRFIFPKTAFNTGVFFEMDEFDYKL